MTLYALNVSLDLVNFLSKQFVYLLFHCHTFHGKQHSSNTVCRKDRSQAGFFYYSLLLRHDSLELPDTL